MYIERIVHSPYAILLVFRFCEMNLSIVIIDDNLLTKHDFEFFFIQIYVQYRILSLPNIQFNVISNLCH